MGAALAAAKWVAPVPPQQQAQHPPRTAAGRQQAHLVKDDERAVGAVLEPGDELAQARVGRHPAARAAWAAGVIAGRTWQAAPLCFNGLPAFEHMSTAACKLASPPPAHPPAPCPAHPPAPQTLPHTPLHPHARSGTLQHSREALQNSLLPFPLKNPAALTRGAPASRGWAAWAPPHRRPCPPSCAPAWCPPP